MTFDNLQCIDKAFTKILPNISDNIFSTCRVNRGEILYFLKMILLKRYYGLSNPSLYEQMKNRLHFQSFVGLRDIDITNLAEAFEKFENSLDKEKLFTLFEQLDFSLLKQGFKVKRVIATEPSLQSVDNLVEYQHTTSCIQLPELASPFFLRTGTSDLDVYSEIFEMNIYNTDLNFEPNYIIDCGSNIGLASIFFKYKYPQSQILAVEPEWSNFEMLERNLSYYFPSVRCIFGAIWNRRTLLTVTPGQDKEKWGYVVSEAIGTAGVTKAYTIDELLEKYDWPHIDLLKVDIEGAEKELFENNYFSWLNKTKVIMIELHDRIKVGCSKNFFAALSCFNFSISRKHNTFICIKDVKGMI